MKEIEKYEKNEPKIFEYFIHTLLKNNIKESHYLLEIMVEQNLIDISRLWRIIKIKKEPYFVQYMSKKDINTYKNYVNNLYRKQIIENYEELSKNDWEVHKKLIKEGHNPNEIAKIIRNDEIEKLQEISSQTNFDFNQRIAPSLYERCSFINEENVTLIDYAAFFSSIKCFKYLLMNGAKVENTGEYAVAGGNEEIIHLCEQNHSTFEDAYETAIEFHRNDIFKYFYENKIKKIDRLKELGNECVLYNNYEIFSYLIKEGMKINRNIINTSAKIGDLYLVKYFLQNNKIPKNILIISAQSDNIELVKYILELKVIDINDVCLFYLIFILIILEFKIIFDFY